MDGRAGRWHLARAGIVNVYQYGDEVLHFGGGRLLLRGVNGSGKSTAMNMLLPFLLEADTRRIDAAGEQSAVLRSWMLSGRDEAQPVGYLWIELSCPVPDGTTSHLVCGCGIKANRNTERVTTWWFITEQRPGIELELVIDRAPVSFEALRATLGQSDVFNHDQRPAYRNEVRRRLFGGADPDQHLRLLHVVRNPRVGDRIDLDLPSYLTDALPQVSESALADAAQPLEELEEHRRNIEELTRTADVLRALFDSYRSYARRTLRDRAELLARRLAARRKAATAHEKASQAKRDADAAAITAGDEVTRLDAGVRTAQAEIDTLRARPEYGEGRELEVVRKKVADAVDSLRLLQRRADDDRRARDRAASGVTHAARAAGEDADKLRQQLGELRSTTVDAGVAATTPNPPSATPSAETDVPLPPDELGGMPAVARGLGEVRAAMVRRESDIDAVRSASAAVASAEQRLRDAERARDAAKDTVAARREEANDASATVARTARQWHEAVERWCGELLAGAARWVPGDEIADPGAVLTDGSVVDRRDEIRTALESEATQVITGLERRQATLAHERQLALADVERLESELAQLDDRRPEPPRQPWQHAAEAGAWVLADLVDFSDELSDEQRAGIEAALEAAGLLGAVVTDDGRLVANTGELLVLAGGSHRAREPLSRWLVVTIPDDCAIAPSVVERVLDAVHVDIADPSVEAGDVATAPGSGGPMVHIRSDGRFRLGPLAGRHHKDVAEHIGTTARLAAVARRKAQLEDELSIAHTRCDLLAERLAGIAGHLGEAHALRANLPSTTPLAEALAVERVVSDQLERDLAALEAAEVSVREHDVVHAERRAELDRIANDRALPTEPRALDAVVAAVARTGRLVEQAGSRTEALERSHRAWVDAAARWKEAVERFELSDDTHARAAQMLEIDRAQLARREELVGAAYAEVLDAIQAAEQRHTGISQQLGRARDAHIDAVRAQEQADGQVQLAAVALDDATNSCREARMPLDAAVGNRALVAAAVAPDDPEAPAEPAEIPAAPADIEGDTALVSAVLDTVSPPARPEVGADSVRQGLRQRRDSLGAGWDAEDRQPGDDAPLVIEVTGPLGHGDLTTSTRLVTRQLTQQISLLTAKQDQALRNLLQGLVAKDVSRKMAATDDLVRAMNERLNRVKTSHGVGVALRWRRRDDLDERLAGVVDVLAQAPDLRTRQDDERLSGVLSALIDDARRAEPETPYRELLRRLLDHREWHTLTVMVERPGHDPARLTRRTKLSEGEKKLVTYLPLFAAVAASADALAEVHPEAPRFVLLDDAFAKVSEDNHPRLFGLLTDLDLDWIATSERLWGTYATVPALAITEVLRDADLGAIALLHSRWDGHELTQAA